MSGGTSGAPALAVYGAGSWGTALAIQAARSGNRVRLHGRDADAMRAMASARENPRYLPGIAFPPTLEPVTGFGDALTGPDGDGLELVLVSVPSHAFRATLEALRDALGARVPGLGLVWATKGLELATGRMTHEVAAEVLPDCRAHAVLSGPSFATEVARGLPTAITAAATELGFARTVAARFSGPAFRVYTSDDIVGVEVGGAVKNVIAIAAGFCDGGGYGANARVALINRGLREMARFGRAIGAREATFQGLACMGDLVLTCTDDQSRNRRMGLALARGLSVDAAATEIGQVVEGVRAARAVHQKALALDVDMPITRAVHGVLHEGVAPADAVRELLARSAGDENA